MFELSENLSQKAQTEKVRQRVAEHKERRQIENKLSRTKALGESEDDDDDSAQAWVVRSRKMHEERVQAEKRVRLNKLSYTVYRTIIMVSF